MPAEAWSGYRRFCPLARSLDVIGERWTLVIVHELLSGARRYGELQARLPGIGTSVLADRLRKLEHAGVVARRPGEQGAVVLYELTEAGRELGPAMEALRSWGVRYLYQPLTDADDGVECFDVSFVVGHERLRDEEYEWRIDDRPIALHYEAGRLCRRQGAAHRPAVIATTTGEFMQRWAAGTTSWDQGRASGHVQVRGSDAAWTRMLAATGYLRRYEADTDSDSDIT